MTTYPYDLLKTRLEARGFGPDLGVATRDAPGAEVQRYVALFQHSDTVYTRLTTDATLADLQTRVEAFMAPGCDGWQWFPLVLLDMECAPTTPGSWKSAIGTSR